MAKVWAAAAEHFDGTVLLGIGGSSLGPEVVRRTVGSESFLVLDTTRAWMNYLARFTSFVPEQALSPGRISVSLGFEEAL